MNLDTILRRVVYPLIKKIEFDGLILEVIGTEDNSDWQLGEHKKFIFTIHNPKDIPYSLISLQDTIDSRIEEAFRIASYDGPGKFIPHKFWDFDSYIKRVYVPKKLEREINKCITSINKSTQVSIDLGVFEEQDLKLKIDYSFSEIHSVVNEDDNINVYVSVYINDVMRWNSEKKDFVYTDLDDNEKSFLYETLNEMRYDGFEIFSNSLWHCFEPLYNKKTFIDLYRHGMGTSFDFHIK